MTNFSNQTELENLSLAKPPGPASTPYIWLISYCFLYPALSFIGVFGNTVCFVAFVKCFKQQKGYIYQIILIITDTLILITHFGYYVFIGILNSRAPLLSNVHIRKNVVATVYSAYLTIQLPQQIATGGLIFFVGVFIDRYQALKDPQGYQHRDPVKRAAIFAAVAYPIGFLSMVQEYFRFNYVWFEPEGAYRILRNPQHMKNIFSFVGYLVNTGIWVLTPVLTLIFAILIMLTYRKIMKEKKEAQKGRVHGGDKLVDEDVLTVLLLGQSLLVFVGSVETVVIKGILYFGSLKFIITKLLPVVPLLDAISLLPGSWNFFTYLMLSGKFRKEVRTMMHIGSNTVHTV